MFYRMKFFRTRLFLLGAALASCVLTCATDAAIKTLVVTGGHAFDQAPFFKLFSDNPELEVTAASHASKTNASVYDRDDLLSYDVVVLYDMPQRLTDAQKRHFRALFDKGIGLVVLHHALGSFQDYDDFPNPTAKESLKPKQMPVK